MFRNLLNRESKGIAGAILLAASYSGYALLSCWEGLHESLWLSNMYLYMNYTGIALVLWHLGDKATSRNLRLLLYYPTAVLYAIVIFSYILDDLFETFVQTKLIVLPSILLTWTCFLLFIRRSSRT